MEESILIKPEISCLFIIPFRIRALIFGFSEHRDRKEFLCCWQENLASHCPEFEWKVKGFEKYYRAEEKEQNRTLGNESPLCPPISIVNDKEKVLVGKWKKECLGDTLKSAIDYAKKKMGELDPGYKDYLGEVEFPIIEALYHDWSLGCLKARMKLPFDQKMIQSPTVEGAEFIRKARQFAEYILDHLVGKKGVMVKFEGLSEKLCHSMPGFEGHRKEVEKALKKAGKKPKDGPTIERLSFVSMNLIGHCQASNQPNIRIPIVGNPFSNITGPTNRNILIAINKNGMEYAASGYDGNFALIGRKGQYISPRIAESRMEWLWILATIYASGLMWTQDRLLQHMGKIISEPQDYYKRSHKREELASLHFASMTVIHEASVSNIAEDSFSNIVYGDLWRNYQMESLSSDLKDQFRMIFERLQFIENEQRLAYTKQIEKFAILASVASLFALTISTKEELVFASKKMWGKDIGEAIDYGIVVFMGLLIPMGVYYLGRIVGYRLKEWWKHWGFSKKRNSKAE